VDEKLQFCHRVVTDKQHLARYGRNVDEQASANVAEGSEPTSLSIAGGGADEASRVVRRLKRIEALERGRASAGQLLGELRALVDEAEAWARAGVGDWSGDAVGASSVEGSASADGAEVPAETVPPWKSPEEVEGMH
jgi:hypothetical protein